MRFTALWWWIDRWRKSTAFMDMTLAEQGAYRNLLDEAHLRGGPLPLDERILAKACGDALAWPSVRAAVMARFVEAPDGWHNATLDEVMQESNRRAEKQRQYRERGNTNGNGDNNGTGNKARPPVPVPVPVISSGSSSRSKPSPAPSALDVLFQSFWSAYPKKVGKEAARKIWARLKPSQELLDRMLRAINEQCQSDQWQKDQGQFVPHPATWLNQGRWDDEPTLIGEDVVIPPAIHENRPHAAGKRPVSAFDADWWEECKLLHDGQCDGDRMRHHLRVQSDRTRAG